MFKINNNSTNDYNYRLYVHFIKTIINIISSFDSNIKAVCFNRFTLDKLYKNKHPKPRGVQTFGKSTYNVQFLFQTLGASIMGGGTTTKKKTPKTSFALFLLFYKTFILHLHDWQRFQNGCTIKKNKLSKSLRPK